MNIIKAISLKYFFILLFCVNSFGQESKKAILFFDMNNSFNEVEAAKKAAKERGDTLIVYPKTSLEVAFNKDQLAEALKEISHQNIEVSTIIISGHHTGKDGYFGETKRGGKYLFNQISSNDFRDEIAKFPKIRNSIRSLFGAGCHTMTKPRAKEWVSYFENLETCYGYMDLGPMNADASASQNIYDFLIKEKEIAGLNSVNKIFKLGSSIFKYPQMTNSAIWTANRGQYCDVKGKESFFNNCSTYELYLKKYYIMLEAKVMRMPIKSSPINMKTFGAFYKYPDLDKDENGNYWVSDRISISVLEFLAKDAIKNIQSNCNDSPLLKQLSFNEIDKVKDVHNLLSNHRAYFSHTLNILAKMGINYPDKNAKFKEYQNFYNKARLDLSIESRRLKERLKSQKEKNDDNYIETQSNIYRIQKLEGIVKFMRGQYIDKKCLKKEWYFPYKPDEKEKLMGPMKEDPDFCKNN